MTGWRPGIGIDEGGRLMENDDEWVENVFVWV